MQVGCLARFQLFAEDPIAGDQHVHLGAIEQTGRLGQLRHALFRGEPSGECHEEIVLAKPQLRPEIAIRGGFAECACIDGVVQHPFAFDSEMADPSEGFRGHAEAAEGASLRKEGHGVLDSLDGDVCEGAADGKVRRTVID